MDDLERSDTLDWAKTEIEAMSGAAMPQEGRSQTYGIGLALSPNSCGQIASGLERLLELATHASYDRVVLVDVLTAHQRKDAGSCICGWGVREAYGPDWENTHGSHSEHVARMYELEVQRRLRLAAADWPEPPAGPVT